jgi:hypothetical protein
MKSEGPPGRKEINMVKWSVVELITTDTLKATLNRARELYGRSLYWESPILSVQCWLLQWLFWAADEQRASPWWVQYLSMFQWHQSGVIGGADHFIISSVGGWPPSWSYVIACQTLCVTDCVVLPGAERGAIHRTLQNPVSGSWGIGSFNDHIRNLKDLKQRHWQITWEDKYCTSSLACGI